MERESRECFSLLFFFLCLFSDIRRLNRQSLRAINSGMIILGGGLTKHHICNANLMVMIAMFV